MNGKKVIITLLTVAFLSFVLFSFFGDQGWFALLKGHRQLTELESEVKRSVQVIDSLKKEIDRLKNDTSYLEKIAREKLGMARRDEKIYKFVEESD
jgi:cell division protein FtsB